jgi:hypothetical protein
MLTTCGQNRSYISTHLDRRLTLTIHVCVEVQLGNVVGWSRLEPNTLPYSTARGIEDVTWSQGLLSNGNDIVAGICGVVHENKSLLWSDRQSTASLISGNSQLILLAEL